MLGEKFHDLTGKITGVRVLPGDILETSFQGAIKVLGIDGTDIGTFTAVLQPNGFIRGEGQGVSMMSNGESFTWRGQGIGKPTGKGLGASYRYGITMSVPPTSKLAKLNGVYGVGEFEVDELGNVKGATWEWR